MTNKHRFLTTVVGVVMGLSGGCGKPAATPAPADAKGSQPVGESLLVEFEKLKGKWLRADGGYVLELKRLLPENTLTVHADPGHVSWTS